MQATESYLDFGQKANKYHGSHSLSILWRDIIRLGGSWVPCGPVLPSRVLYSSFFMQQALRVIILHGCHTCPVELNWDIKRSEKRHRWFRAVPRDARLPVQHMENLGAVGLQELGPGPDLPSGRNPAHLMSAANPEGALRQLIRNSGCHHHSHLLCSQTLLCFFTMTAVKIFFLFLMKWMNGDLETWLIIQSGEIALWVIIR